ncbi:MAG: hypothetical protein VYA69_04460 [Gemmatimonadota bacterium]|nr:hypothetical protein [Gemmatimonadota bacterium]
MNLLRNRQVWGIFLSCWIIYIFHIGPIPGVNENRYLDLVRSMVEEGELTLDRYHFNTVDKLYRGGHYYAGAAPGLSIVSIPAYLILNIGKQAIPMRIFNQYDTSYYIREQLGGANAPDSFVTEYPFGEFLLAHVLITACVNSLLAAGIVVLIDLVLRWFSISFWQRLIVHAVYAFGTITFFYATRLYAHVSSTFWVFLTFVILFAMRRQQITIRGCAAAGFALGMGALTEYTVAPVIAVLGVYSLVTLKKKELIVFILACMIPLGCLMLYQYVCFGGPLTTAYSTNFPMNQDGDLGPRTTINTGFNGFGIPSLASLWGLTLSPYRGLFIYSPVLIVAVYILFRRIRDKNDTYRLEWRIIWAVFLLQFLFNSTMLTFWSGGYVWGPRYLMPLLPFLMIPLGLAFRSIPSPVIISLGTLSILINWTGVQYIVSQNPFNSIGMFLLSGPTTQFYEFLKEYFKTYTEWEVAVSPFGGYLLLGILLTAIWKWWGQKPEVN